jgi:hypothetical protein
MMPFVAACATCFAAEESSLIDGARLGIAAMLAVTFAVQGGFAAFFFYLRKRARNEADAEIDQEWSVLQKDTRR